MSNCKKIRKTGENELKNWEYIQFLDQNDQINPNSFDYNNEEQEQNDMTKDQAYQILYKSTFNLVLEHKKGVKNANIKYNSIKYGVNENSENEQSLEIDDIKKISPTDEKLNTNFQKFMEFLENIETELKSRYKSEKSINIEIKFTLVNSYTVNNSNYNISCNYNINDENIEEKEFTDEDFLNNTNHNGLNFLINALENLN